MPIPKQVIEAGKRADEIALNIQGKTADKDKAAPEDSASGVQGEVIDLKGHQVAEKHEDTVESLKHKLSVLQGKYDSEVKPLKEDIGMLNRMKSDLRRVTDTNTDLLRRNNDLALLVSDLQKKITEPQKPVVEEKKPAGNVEDFIPTELLSKEDMAVLDEEGLGSDVLKVFAKLVAAVAQKSAPASTIDPKLESRIENLEKKDERTTKTSFIDAVTKGVSGEKNDMVKARAAFDAINRSAKFNDWLAQVDVASGKTRKALLNEAGSQHDSARVIAIFKMFQNSQAPEKDTSKQKKLEAEVEVPSSNATHELPEASGDTASLVAKWTPEAIRKFYKEVSTGRYSDKEQKAIEGEIWKVNQHYIKNSR